MQTIGERLEEARKRKGISIREASEATKIRSDYLQKFENNTFELNLPDIYVRGFLRTYAHYLKLNSEKLLTDYASLGLSDSRDSRRHSDHREIMGRIDLPDASKSAPVPDLESPSSKTQPAPSRSVPTAVVTGAPSADRREKVKLPIIIGGAVLALIVLVVLVRALWPESSSTAGKTTTPANGGTDVPAQPAAVTDRNVIRLVALGNVWVKVVQQSDNKTLFEGDLLKGETRAVLRSGKVFVSYDLGRNLQVEVLGSRFRMSAEGQGRNRIDEPSP